MLIARMSVFYPALLLSFLVAFQAQASEEQSPDVVEKNLRLQQKRGEEFLLKQLSLENRYNASQGSALPAATRKTGASKPSQEHGNDISDWGISAEALSNLHNILSALKSNVSAVSIAGPDEGKMLLKDANDNADAAVNDYLLARKSSKIGVPQSLDSDSFLKSMSSIKMGLMQNNLGQNGINKLIGMINTADSHLPK